MVYPVSNPLVQQQIPAANTFQPGGTESTKRPEENKVQDSTRPSGSDSARTEKSTNRDATYQAASSDDRARDSGGVSASSSRGTQLNISV